MTLLRAAGGSPLTLQLNRNLTRSVKRGHPWVYGDALRRRPKATPGSRAILLDHKKGRAIGRGFYDPGSPLALRLCTAEAEETLDEAWAERRLERALALRQPLFTARTQQTTTAFRLFNGEGDGLPGLICDLYGDTAVLQLDGAGPKGFWNPDGIAAWLADRLALGSVYEKYQARQSGRGRALWGPLPTEPVPFLENGLRFTADVIHGQKTGFFLDQRENRQRMRAWAEGRRVLNVFGYTGGFSVYAGRGGATDVTTVDLAEPALALADAHWRLNDLPPAQHRSQTADAFDFLARAAKQRQQWALVILDPPSFAPAKAALPQALKAYHKLIAAGAAVTSAGGLLAAASCSSHIDEATFLEACETGISQARRRATLVGSYGQPADHPSPLVLREFRYLQFMLLSVE